MEQFFDPVKKMFLADRYIKGECPNCGAKNRIDESKAAQAQPKCGRCGTTLGSAAATSSSSKPPAAAPMAGVLRKQPNNIKM